MVAMFGSYDDDLLNNIWRDIAGIIGGVMLIVVFRRLIWWSPGGVYKTVWDAIALPHSRSVVGSSWRWSYGFWELFPDGQLAALATIAMIVGLIGYAITERTLFVLLIAVTFLSGYLINAYLFLKLLAAY